MKGTIIEGQMKNIAMNCTNADQRHQSEILKCKKKKQKSPN